MNSAANQGAPFYDVVVIGGALSGAATATLLLRQNSDLRILIVEKSAQLTRRVGEATVEVSAFFMGRVLGLTQYLNESHLVKQGLRFWFTNDEVKSLDGASELGGHYQVRLPSYQLDRAAFDEEVLHRACAAGAELLRPASVTKVELSPGGEQTIVIRHSETTQTVRARWLGRRCIARTEGRLVATEYRASHRRRMVAVERRERLGQLRTGGEISPVGSAVCGIRGTATNHVIGDGWWSWWIPLKGGDVSVGVVFDQRIVDWPHAGGKLGDRLKKFLMQHPVGREMLVDAQFDENDVHWRKNLAYYSTTFAGDGFVLVGDAAAFMDPFYSPGMDWISFTATSAAELITAQRRGEPMAQRIERYNRDFALSYRSWFESVYKDKYEYMGEWDLMSLAFRLDLGLYYLGIVSQPFKLDVKALLSPPFTTSLSRPVFHLMRTYNRRFAQIARRRRRMSALGKANRGQRCLIKGFTLSLGDSRLLFNPLFKWGWLELKEGWRSWWQPRENKVPVRIVAMREQRETVGDSSRL